uniref:Uncharacterized protein n=1 Tax=Ananas comosus var. bracteatus TaxID=296719 RepID=A0A6V7QSA0_ANACO
MEEARGGSPDVCYGARHSTLLDEFERLTIEIQMNKTILRRSYSAPSPARFAVQFYRPVQQRIPPPCPEPPRGSRRPAATLRRWLRFAQVFAQWTRSKRMNRPVPRGRTQKRMEI